MKYFSILESVLWGLEPPDLSVVKVGDFTGFVQVETLEKRFILLLKETFLGLTGEFNLFWTLSIKNNLFKFFFRTMANSVTEIAKN